MEIRDIVENNPFRKYKSKKVEKDPQLDFRKAHFLQTILPDHLQDILQ